MRYVFTNWKNEWDQSRNFKYNRPIVPDEFRGGYYEYLKKEPNTFRIIVLGDSFTFGDCVADLADVYTSVMERRLNEYFKNKILNLKIEVVNMGVCGFSTMNELELLQRTGIKFQPDMVMVQFLSNDMEISDVGYYHLLTPDRFKVRKELIPDKKVHAWLMGHSYFYAWLNRKYFDLQCRYKIPPDHLVREDNPGWKQCRLAMGYIRQFCTANNLSQPVMVMFPMLLPGKWDMSTYPQKFIYDKARGAAQDAGFAVCDLLPVFFATKRNLREFWAFSINPHPNVQAHALAGEAIASYLISTKIVEDRVHELIRRYGHN